MIRARREGLQPANEFLTRLAEGIDRSFDTLDDLLKIEIAKQKGRGTQV